MYSYIYANTSSKQPHYFYVEKTEEDIKRVACDCIRAMAIEQKSMRSVSAPTLDEVLVMLDAADLNSAISAYNKYCEEELHVHITCHQIQKFELVE